MRPYFTVSPRYTCGSPAMVDGEIAQRVAKQEKNAIEYVLEGYEGEESKAKAERLGLRGIAEMKVEKGSGKKHGWEVWDLCTGEHFFRLCADALEKLGWRRYSDLQKYEQAIVDSQAPKDVENHRQGWYKLEVEQFAAWPQSWNVEVYRPEKI